MASEQINKRLQNQYHILRALHFDGACQRTQLSKKFGIRKTSVTNIVADLLRRKIVVAEDPESIRSPIALDNERYHALVAYITAERIHFARIFLNGTIEDETSVDIKHCSHPDAIIKELTNGLNNLRQSREEFQLGVGVSVPGFVDPDKGVSLHAVNLPDWTDIELKSILEDALDCPVLVENDVRAQLWSCTWFDHISNLTDNIFYLNVHEGVACAIIMHGQLIIGENYAAGEIGQVYTPFCQNGNDEPQRLETYCSLPAIIRSIQSDFPNLDVHEPSDIVTALQKEPQVNNLLEQVAEHLARVLAGLIAAIDPSAIALGTPSRGFSTCFAPILQKHLADELKTLGAGETDLIVAEEASVSALKGVAGLVIDQAFKTGAFSV